MRIIPQMKKLACFQGKLLIKLVDRECNQSSISNPQSLLAVHDVNSLVD